MIDKRINPWRVHRFPYTEEEFIAVIVSAPRHTPPCTS